MDAQQLLAVLQPFKAIGLTIRDMADPLTWTIDGIAEADRPAAIAALAQAMAAVLPPDPLVVLQQAVTELQAATHPIGLMAQAVGNVQINVTALAGKVGMILPKPVVIVGTS